MLAEEPDIELLLLDINMPVMDGLTLLAELRARRLPVRAVIVSAYGDMTNIRTAMNRGAFDFVTKPVDFADLEVTIDKTLESIADVPRRLDRQRAAAERARANLARYFSPNLVEMLADRDEPLGAVRRETVAVLFVDIVGFTTMAETMPPEQVVDLLRDFHKRMAAQIFAWGGTVRNTAATDLRRVRAAQGGSRRRAANALRCANGILSALDAWNAERAGRGKSALSIGIGLNYGPVVMGDVGSDQGLSFTVSGIRSTPRAGCRR